MTCTDHFKRENENTFFSLHEFWTPYYKFLRNSEEEKLSDLSQTQEEVLKILKASSRTCKYFSFNIYSTYDNKNWRKKKIVISKLTYYMYVYKHLSWIWEASYFFFQIHIAPAFTSRGPSSFCRLRDITWLAPPTSLWPMNTAGTLGWHPCCSNALSISCPFDIWSSS